MERRVQIDERLFLELVKYHCCDLKDDDFRNEYIMRELTLKLDALNRHDAYTKKIKKQHPHTRGCEK